MTLWDNDLIQFARLLDEIRATQENLDYDALSESMDLDDDGIDELFERAMKVWERAKAELKFQQDGVFHEPIPDDYEVQPLPGWPDHIFNDGQRVVDYPDCRKCHGPCKMAKDPAQCGHCRLIWDDGMITGLTPTPSGRCPFEYFHLHPPED